MQRRRAGFTLIELSIVLVIIGLIVGSVLVGRDLIHAAELRKITSQMVAYHTAINTFRTKYNCPPGDCNQAASLFTGTLSGNGNGVIEYSVVVGGQTSMEGVNAWSHLSQAGLIEGNYVNNPLTDTLLWPGKNVPAGPLGNSLYYLTSIVVVLPNVVGGSMGADYYPAKSMSLNQNYLLFGSVISTNPKQSVDFILNGPDMYAIDSKMDDGMPYTGRWLAASRETQLTPACVSPSNPWLLNDTTLKYDFTVTTPGCAMTLLLSF